MSKKTLNESTIRRFMGLANIQPTVVSNYIKENYNEEKEELEELDLKKRRDAAGGEYKATPGGKDFGKLSLSRDKDKAHAFNKGVVDVEDTEMEEAEDPALDAEAPPEGDMGDDVEVDPAAMDAEMPPEEEGAPELEITQEEAAVLMGVLEKLTAAMPAGEEAPMEEPPMEEPPMDAEMPPEEEMPPEDEEELMEKALEETEVELSEDEVVNEVAKRVAARILKAKQAKAKMDEALGNKKK